MRSHRFRAFIYTDRNCRRKPGLTVEEALQELGGNEVAEMGVQIPLDLITDGVRLCCSLCLLENAPSVIEPDVLSKDKAGFQGSGDQKHVDKAHRRGKVGWNVGRHIEVSPHYRRRHMALVWTGRGRAVPRRGSVVHRKKVEKVPSGFGAADQMGMLSEYMTLARLLQPSVVVIEDVDLIARERTQMDSACQESLLNRLLNEMDSLKEEAAILFILTTNRPAQLEQALSAIPGRIDQAIEFPVPDEESRRKLACLYSRGISIADGVLTSVVAKTKKTSAAFIKELMRRSVVYHLDATGETMIELEDVESALEELLVSSGSLNHDELSAPGSAHRARCHAPCLASRRSAARSRLKERDLLCLKAFRLQRSFLMNLWLKRRAYP